MPPPPASTPISPNICRACIILIDRTAHPTCTTSGPAKPCAACTLRGSPCEPVPATLQLQLTDLIYYHARWRTACAGTDKAIATRTKKELTANVMDFIELLDEEKVKMASASGDGDAEAEDETGVLIPAIAAKKPSVAVLKASAGGKASKATSAPSTTQAGKKRANDHDSQAGEGPVKKAKASTARAPSRTKTQAHPKLVKSKANTPEKDEKAQKATIKPTAAPLLKQVHILAIPQTTDDKQNPSANANAATVMPTSSPRAGRTSYPLSSPEIAVIAGADVVSDPSSCDTSLTASTLPYPAMFTSDYLTFDFDFPHDLAQSDAQAQAHPPMPSSSSHTSPSFHSAQQLGPAITDGHGSGNAAGAFHTHTHMHNLNNFDLNTDDNPGGHGGEHDVGVQILEQLRTMNATLQGMHEMMQFQAQAQTQVSSAASGGIHS